MNRVSTVLLAFIVFSLFTFTSCDKQDDPQPEETEENNTNGENNTTPTVSDDAKTNGQSVKTSEDPKSDKVKGEQTVNGNINVQSPSSMTLSPEALAKLHQVTGNNSNSSAKVAEDALSGWFIDEINGENVIGTEAGDTYMYFFYNDGYYLEYNLETYDWNWGFFYIDTEVSTIVFDLEDEDQQIWSISSISDETLDITSEQGDQYVLNAYDLGGFEEDEYDNDDIAAQLDGVELYINYNEYDGVDLNEDDAFYDIQFDGFGTDTIPIITLHANGTLDAIDREIVYDNFAIETTSTVEGSATVGTWTVDQEGYLVMTFDSHPDEEFIFYIAYMSSDELELIGYSTVQYDDIYWWMMDEDDFLSDIFFLGEF